MTMTPENTPEDPTPASALPRMNVTELGAAPHSAEPASKIIIAARNTNLLLYNRYKRPNGSWVAQLART